MSTPGKGIQYAKLGKIEDTYCTSNCIIHTHSGENTELKKLASQVLTSES